MIGYPKVDKDPKLVIAYLEKQLAVLTLEVEECKQIAIENLQRGDLAIARAERAEAQIVLAREALKP